MDNLECPICLETARDAVECEGCAQILCNECTLSLKRCPICRKECSFKVSAFARRLINNLPTECAYCNFKTTNAELKYHLETCPEKIVNCSLCSSEFKCKELIEHATIHHIDELTKVFYDSQYDIQSSNENIESKKLTEKLIKLNNLLVWENKTKYLVNNTTKLITRTGINSFSNIDVKFKFNCKNTSYVVVGLSDRIFNIAKGYLGGDLGKGNWGIAGNGSLGEEGKWVTGSKYNNNDIINIKFDNGYITYTINGIRNNYKHKFSSNKAYIACTLYNINDKLEIIDNIL